MTVKAVKETIADAAAVVEAASSGAAADEIRDAGALLGEDAERPAAEAIAELEQLLGQQRRELIVSYAERLRQAGTDEAAFGVVEQALEADALMGRSDVEAIAHAYCQGRSKWPSRKAALKAIRTKFTERAYNESKMRIVERSRVW